MLGPALRPNQGETPLPEGRVGVTSGPQGVRAQQLGPGPPSAGNGEGQPCSLRSWGPAGCSAHSDSSLCEVQGPRGTGLGLSLPKPTGQKQTLRAQSPETA